MKMLTMRWGEYDSYLKGNSTMAELAAVPVGAGSRLEKPDKRIITMIENKWAQMLTFLFRLQPIRLTRSVR